MPRPEPDWWPECRRLRAAGWKQIALAAHFKTSLSSVKRCLNPGLYRKIGRNYYHSKNKVRQRQRYRAVAGIIALRKAMEVVYSETEE